jgi:hypothetical protein
VPGPTTPPALASRRFGLVPFRSPLLRESRLMSSRRATEMFQFARCPPHGLWIQPWVSRHDSGWVAPFGSSGLLARMQLPLNVSPVSASFIGLQCRGIHLVLLLACSRICSLFLPMRGKRREGPLLLLLLYGKIEVRKDSVVQCASCQSPGNWRVENSLRCFFCVSRSRSTWEWPDLWSGEAP